MPKCKPTLPSTTARQPVVSRGRHVLSSPQWQRLAVTFALSPREEQILRGLFDDLTEFAIARELGISPHTVHTHLERLYRKLEANSRPTAIVRVFSEHLRLREGDRDDAGEPRPEQPT